MGKKVVVKPLPLRVAYMANLEKSKQIQKQFEIRERHGRRREEPREEELHMSKSKIPLFLGDCKPYEYVDLELMFYGYALVWWNQVLEEIKSDKRGPCKGWRDLKQLMRERFVPSSYIWYLYVKLQRIHQGPYSVEEYHKDMKMDLLRA
ncbi:hypothetical protein CR513_23609, partial [Mucuna pruriens]